MRTRHGPGGDDPLVSVLIPTYNRAALLERCIGSVLAQTYDRLEVLVVDDGSTDDTAARVQAMDDVRIRYLRLPRNRGVSAARNHGLGEARGDLIAFLDSDDEWLPEKLERQVALFRGGTPRLGLVYAGLETVDSRGGTRVDLPEHRGRVYPTLLHTNVIIGGGSNAVVRRAVLEHVGGFDETLPAIEDYDLWVRIARHYDVDFVPEPLVRYHDPAAGRPRKSLEVRENQRARDAFYRKHREEMAAYGTAHHFLQQSARRHLLSFSWDAAEARRLCLLAIRHAPLQPRSYGLLALSLVPGALYRWAARLRGRLRSGR